MSEKSVVYLVTAREEGGVALSPIDVTGWSEEQVDLLAGATPEERIEIIQRNSSTDGSVE
jgi:hypothetical protein